MTNTNTNTTNTTNATTTASTGELTARFGFLAKTEDYGLLPEVFARDFTGKATQTPRRGGVVVEFDRERNAHETRPAGAAWVFVFANRDITREEVLALFPEICAK